MRLHEDEKLFHQAVNATAAHLGIPEIFIEKDYWVTYALHAIFHDDIGVQTVFKGGDRAVKMFWFESSDFLRILTSWSNMKRMRRIINGRAN